MFFHIIKTFLQSSFSDYYGVSPSYITEKQSVKQIEALDLSYNLKDNTYISLYTNQGTNGHILWGGAIHFRSSGLIRLLIETCMFYNCTGGGIYFYCPSDGRFVLTKSCAHSCFTDWNDQSNGQFSQSVTRSNGFNYYELNSVILCSPEAVVSATRYSPIYLNYGNQKIYNINMSQNRVYQSACFYTANVGTLNISFSSFSDNHPSYSICFYIHMTFTDLVNRRMRFCNIIRNQSPLQNAIFYLQLTNADHKNYHIQFEDCIFLQNSNSLFQAVDTAYYFILRGWIQHIGKIVTGNEWFSSSLVKIQGITTSTYEVDHFRTYYCNNNVQEMEIIPCQTLNQFFPTPTECFMTFEGQTNPILNLFTIFELIIPFVFESGQNI